MKSLTILGMLLLSAVSPLLGEEARIATMNPKGTPPPIRLIPMAARLDNLDGRTVYIVDVRFSGGDLFLNQMVSWFAQNMPKVKVVYRRKSGAYAEDDPKLWQEIKEKGDAMIMAIGH